MSKETVKILIFDNDVITSTLIENYLKEVEFPYEILKFSKFEESVLNDDSLNKIVFIDVTKDTTSALEVISAFSLNPKNIFFAMSSKPTTDLYVKSLRVGSKDFLKKPLVKEDFLNAIKNNYKYIEKKEQIIDETSSKIISVTSLERGCGKTSFAINTAYELAYLTKEKVLLIDFNDNLNNVTFSLDIDQQFDTHYFCNYTTEKNAEQMISKVLKYKDTSLYVMSSCMYRSKTYKFASDNFHNFFQIIRKYFKYIIIDVNNDYEVTNRAVFLNTDMIFYIISSSITSNERNENYINVNYGKRRFRIILNKYRPKDDAKLNQIETILKREVFYKIPMNLSVTAASGNIGKTLREINPELDIVHKYDNLAKYIINKV